MSEEKCTYGKCNKEKEIYGLQIHQENIMKEITEIKESLQKHMDEEMENVEKLFKKIDEFEKRADKKYATKKEHERNAVEIEKLQTIVIRGGKYLITSLVSIIIVFFIVIVTDKDNIEKVGNLIETIFGI